MSEGLLYYLGVAALRHVDGSRPFLVEEPENGLHPTNITEVMNVLREVSKTGQVIVATHSPMRVNGLEGHEISEEQGTRAVLLSETPNYDKRSEIYLNGELWVAYGNRFEGKSILNGGATTMTQPGGSDAADIRRIPSLRKDAASPRRSTSACGVSMTSKVAPPFSNRSRVAG